MDVLGKVVWAAMILWLAAMAVGLLLAAMPVILAVVGFLIMTAVLAWLGRLVAGWLFY